MVVLSLAIQPNFVNQRIQSPFHPTCGTELFRNFAPVTQIITMLEDLFRLGKPDSAARIFLKLSVFASVKMKSQAGITLIPHLTVSLERGSISKQPKLY